MIDILVLSLATATDRRAASIEQFERYDLPFRFFDAPIGKNLSDAQIASVYDESANIARYKAPLTKGEVACYLGHLEMWHQIAERDTPVTLILEDDFRFLRDPRPVLEDALVHNLSDLIVKIDGEVATHEPVVPFGDAALVRSNVLPPRTTGYLIGAGATAKLLAARQRFFRPVDMDLKHYWEHGVPILALRPALISERPDTVSTLTRDRVGRKARSPLARLRRNLGYQWAFRKGIRSTKNAEGVVPTRLDSDQKPTS